MRKHKWIGTVALFSAISLFLAPVPAKTQSTRSEPRVIAPHEGHVAVAPHAELQVKVGSVSTGSSQLFMAIATFVPGGETGTHLHEIDAELLYVLDGEVTVTLEDQEHTVGPGGTVIIPPGVWMAIANRTDAPAVVLGVLSRGNLEECFRVLFSEDADETARSEALEHCKVRRSPSTPSRQ